MTTSISTKLAALALALMFNSVIMGGIAYLFNAQLQQPTAVTALASTARPQRTTWPELNKLGALVDYRATCPSHWDKHIERAMDPNWNDNQPIYRQLRDRM